VLTLDDLRAVLEQAASDLPDAEVHDAIGLSAAFQSRMLARSTAPTPATLVPKLVDAEKMAALLDVPENWVRDKARAGILPSQRLEHYVRFNPAEVFEAVRKLPRLQNRPVSLVKKRKETRGGKRAVSTKCPSPPADSTPADKPSEKRSSAG
jgi:hypothetical protein